MVRRVIRSGILGETTLVTILQHSALVAAGLPKAFNADWWFDPARGGGILNAAGVHVIDRLRTWMGEIIAVSAHLQVVGNHPAGSAEDTYSMTLRFESGAVGTAQHCTSAFGTPSRITRVFGRAGSVWSDGTDAWLGYRDGSHRLDVPPDLQVPPPPPPSTDPREAFSHLELGPYIRLAERFRDEIAGVTPSPDAPPTPTFRDGVAAQLVIDAVRHSAAHHGAWVDVEQV
jgi:predicted dehydrogenase